MQAPTGAIGHDGREGPGVPVDAVEARGLGPPLEGPVAVVVDSDCDEQGLVPGAIAETPDVPAAVSEDPPCPCLEAILDERATVVGP